MKNTVLFLVVFRAVTTSANIIFNKVQPTCDYTALSYTGCLRGQLCLPDNT